MQHPLRLVLLVVAALMLWSLDHGLPHRYVPDDTVVRCALGIARDVSVGEGSLLEALVPPGTRYTTYPYLLPYLDLGVLGLTYVLGRAGQRWGGLGEFQEAIFADPGVAWLPGRLVSVLLGLLVPWGLYRAARELGRDKGEAALAALLGGSSLLLVQYAHTVRPWAPMLGFGAASLALSLRMQRKRTLRPALAAFAAAAAAGATFQVGLAFLAVPLAALLPAAAADRRRGQAWLPRALQRLLLGGAAAATVLAVGYPHLLLHGAATGHGYQIAESALAQAGQTTTVQIGGQAFGLGSFSGMRLGEASRSWLGYDPVLILCGFAGLFLWMAERRRLAAWLLVVAPALLFSAVFLLYDGTHVRYLMPAHLFLALGAARLLGGWVRRGTGGAALAALVVMFPLVQDLRLDWLLGQEDTRTQAARELPRIVTRGQRVALDGMGGQYAPPLAPTAAGLQAFVDDWNARARGPEEADRLWLTRSEQRWLEGALREGPENRELIPIQRYWAYDSYFPHHPRDFLIGGRDVELGQWMDQLGIDVYLQVDRLPDAARRQPVTDFTAARGRLLWELSPTGASPPARAELPTDLTFALTDLWTYRRPGPWIRAWRVGETGDT